MHFIWLCGFVVYSSVALKSKSSPTKKWIFSPNQPRLYEPNSFDVQHVVGRSNSSLMLEFTQVDFCHKGADYLVLFDGPDCLAPRFAIVRQHDSKQYYTTQHALTLLTVTDSELQCTGFVGNYEEVSPKYQLWPVVGDPDDSLLRNCWEYLDSLSQVINISPGVLAQRLCIWKFELNSPGRIRFQLTSHHELAIGSEVRVLDGVNCKAKPVQVFRQGKLLSMDTVVTTGSSAVVTFKYPAGGYHFSGLRIIYDEVEPETETTTAKVIPSTTSTNTMDPETETTTEKVIISKASTNTSFPVWMSTLLMTEAPNLTTENSLTDNEICTTESATITPAKMTETTRRVVQRIDEVTSTKEIGTKSTLHIVQRINKVKSVMKFGAKSTRRVFQRIDEVTSTKEIGTKSTLLMTEAPKLTPKSCAQPFSSMIYMEIMIPLVFLTVFF